MTQKLPTGQRLAADHLQPLLESATNAAEKGAQQFFVRPEYAAALATPFPGIGRALYAGPRLTIADLSGCGDGALLSAVRKHYGIDVDSYGIDIDPRFAESPKDHHRIHTADLTRHVELLDTVKFRSCVTVANPPYSLNWHTDRLDPLLSQSDLYRVKDTWATCSRKPTVDSTIASYLLSLHFLESHGEGFLVTLWSTWERLLANTPAADHAWLTLKLTKAGTMFNPTIGDHYDIAVIYFARDHRVGNPQVLQPADGVDAETLRLFLDAKVDRHRHRTGIYLRRDPNAKARTDQWKAAAGEYRQRHDPDARPEWNLWLRNDGRIGTYLTPFQRTGGFLGHEAVQQLRELDDQTPMGLTVQRNTRTALLTAVHNPLWRVDPALVTAVDGAIRDYQNQRAPLYPLAAVQRLGYLDEEDAIQCNRDGLGPFRAGQRYPIETRTEQATYKTKIANAGGGQDQVTRTGRELVLSVWTSHEKKDDQEHRFIVGGKYEYADTGKLDERDWVHTFADLIDHFHIPEVADVAAAQPERYQQNLDAVDAIEELIRENLNAA